MSPRLHNNDHARDTITFASVAQPLLDVHRDYSGDIPGVLNGMFRRSTSGWGAHLFPNFDTVSGT